MIFVAEDDERESEIIRAQLQHSYEGLRSLSALGIQMCGFIVAADTLLLGYGLSQRQGAFLILASAMPLIMALVGAMVIINGFPMVYVALRAEQRLGTDVDTLVTTFLKIRAPRLLEKITGVLKVAAGEADVRRLVTLRNFIDFRSRGTLLLTVVWLLHIVLAVCSLTFFNYRFL